MILFRESLPKLDGKIRFLHAIPNAPNVDIYGNGKLLYSNLAFGTITDYLELSPQKYDVQLYKSGTSDNPLISESIEILPNSISTLNVTYENDEISFFTVDDGETNTNPLLSHVRFINLSPTAPLLSLRLPEGLVLFDNAEYLETNAYYPLSPGIYNFIVTSSDGALDKFISNVNMTEGLFVTIYIIGLYKGNPQLGYILVKDSLNNSNS